MTKLNYPNDGVYKYCRQYSNSCANNLSRAMNSCSFDIPSDFTYRNYLYNLSGTFRQYYNQINNINERIQKSNDNIKILSSDLLNSVNKMTGIKIKERDRMIY